MKALVLSNACVASGTSMSDILALLDHEGDPTKRPEDDEQNHKDDPSEGARLITG